MDRDVPATSTVGSFEQGADVVLLLFYKKQAVGLRALDHQPDSRGPFFDSLRELEAADVCDRLPLLRRDWLGWPGQQGRLDPSLILPDFVELVHRGLCLEEQIVVDEELARDIIARLHEEKY